MSGPEKTLNFMDTKMKIIVARPQTWIERSKANKTAIWFNDVEALYDTIPKVCEKLGVKCDVRHLIPHTKIREKNSIFLGHHTYGREKNMWHIKKGYAPGYMYFDRAGFSGWSELAEEYEYDVEVTDEIRKTVLDYCSSYIANNESKVQQPRSDKVPNVPYVLVLGQKPADMASQHSYIDTQRLAGLVNEIYKNSGYKVFTKPHPTGPAAKFPGEIISGNMHALIDAAKVIYTVNSGSGFEALYHMKRVFAAGKSDYMWGCDVIKTREDIYDSVDMIDWPVDTDKIIKFIYYCMTEHFVNAYDEDSITRKIQTCLDEYEV
jgi:hypothetical protein